MSTRMATMPLHDRLECPYCGATEGLRIASCDPWGGSVELICEGCFTGQDDGPCFDDLPTLSAVSDAVETVK